MLHGSPENDLPSVLERIPSEKEFHGHNILSPLSTPTYRRKIDSRQPPPPALTRQYTPGNLPIDKRPPGAAGHRDTSKKTRDAAAGLDKEEAPSPAIKKKARTRRSPSQLTFTKLPPSSYMNTAIDTGAPSLLMRVLKGERPARDPVTPLGASRTKTVGRPINITIYLPLPNLDTPKLGTPKPKAIKIKVPRTDACKEVINKLLSKKQVRKHLCHYDLPVKPKEFVLKLHDEDGLPMDGFVPCKAEHSIEEINDDEFCLCVVESRAKVKTPVKRVGNNGMFKVHLPHSDINMTSFKVRKYTCLAEVLRKHLLHQDHVNVGQEFDFYLLKADQDRLRRKSGWLNPHLPLAAMVKQLQIEEVEVRTRSYRDIPTGGDDSDEGDALGSHNRMGSRSTFLLDKVPTDSQDNQNGHTRQRTYQLCEIIFNPYEAYALKSWNVTKVNQRGRKQERIIAVDDKFIYNRRATRGLRQTQRSKRLISDIVDVQYQYDEEVQKRFRLIFKKEESEETVDVNYIARSQRQAAEIVAKINYIRDRLK